MKSKILGITAGTKLVIHSWSKVGVLLWLWADFVSFAVLHARSVLKKVFGSLWKKRWFPHWLMPRLIGWIYSQSFYQRNLNNQMSVWQEVWRWWYLKKIIIWLQDSCKYNTYHSFRTYWKKPLVILFKLS